MRSPRIPLSRRDFLAGMAATATLGACGDGSGARGPTGRGRWTSPSVATDAAEAPWLDEDPFTLGVASGDPLSDSVVLWTRLAPKPLAPGGTGGLPTRRVPVGWELARDPAMRDVVARGVVEADPAFGHAVHVDLAGLGPDRWYWYRFTVDRFESPVGRTRTTPRPGRPAPPLRFALASCQAYTNGFYTPYPHMLEERIDLVCFVGDYIYVGEGSGVRQHDGPKVETLAQYRNRYALYKSDDNLKAVHAAFPWVMTWDDHEVDDNYAGLVAQSASDREGFEERRAAAYQAYYEHMPIRLGPPSGPDFRIYRSFEWGDLASIYLLDSRQYRDDQACSNSIAFDCPERFDASRTMLGDEQEGWFLDGLARSRTRWNLVAQQVMFGNLDFGGLLFNADQWDGYYASRQRILDHVAERGVPNFVVLTGDIHSSWVMDLARVPGDPGSGLVGTELIGTSISTIAVPLDVVQAAERLLVERAPLIHYNNLREKGYVVCEVTPERLRADYRLVDTVFWPTSPIRTATSWEVRNGVPGARPA